MKSKLPRRIRPPRTQRKQPPQWQRCFSWPRLYFQRPICWPRKTRRTRKKTSRFIPKTLTGLPVQGLTDDEAILQALNRLGFGPRPGDLERVKEMGLQKWIDQQLHPESISDSALEARLDRFPHAEDVVFQAARRIPSAASGRAARRRFRRGIPERAAGASEGRNARHADGHATGR